MTDRTIVIYFSRDGSTAVMAKAIAEKLGCASEELKEEKPRRGFLASGFRSMSGKKPALAGNPWAALEGKDEVVLGAPIWAGNGNPVLNSFLDKAELSGKKVAVFTLQADPSKKGAVKVLGEIRKIVEDRGGKVTAVTGFHGGAPGKKVAVDYLKNQLAGWETGF